MVIINPTRQQEIAGRKAISVEFRGSSEKSHPVWEREDVGTGVGSGSWEGPGASSEAVLSEGPSTLLGFGRVCSVPPRGAAVTPPSSASVSFIRDGNADCRLSLSIHSRSQQEIGLGKFYFVSYVAVSILKAL